MCPHVRQILGSPLPEGEIGLGNFLCGVWNNLLFLELSLLVIFAALKHTDGSILCKMVLMFFLVTTTVNDQIITADVIFIHLGVRTWSNRVNGWSNIQLHSCGDGLLLSLLRKMSLSIMLGLGYLLNLQITRSMVSNFLCRMFLCGTRNGMRPTLANPFLSQSLFDFSVSDRLSMGITVADIDFSLIDSVRAKMPISKVQFCKTVTWTQCRIHLSWDINGPSCLCYW